MACKKDCLTRFSPDDAPPIAIHYHHRHILTNLFQIIIFYIIITNTITIVIPTMAGRQTMMTITIAGRQTMMIAIIAGVRVVSFK